MAVGKGLRCPIGATPPMAKPVVARTLSASQRRAFPVRPRAPGERGEVASPVAGHQGEHGLALDLEHQRLDDGADRDPAGLRRVLGGAGGCGELDDAVRQPVRRQRRLARAAPRCW